jgi:alpha-L-fucosidase
VKDVRPYESADIRFTTKDGFLYAFVMNKIESDVQIVSLGKDSKVCDKKVSSVEMLGNSRKLKWKQENEVLVIQKPENTQDWTVTAFKIGFKN